MTYFRDFAIPETASTTGEPEYCTEKDCPCDNGEIKNNEDEE